MQAAVVDVAAPAEVGVQRLDRILEGPLPAKVTNHIRQNVGALQHSSCICSGPYGRQKCKCSALTESLRSAVRKQTTTQDRLLVPCNEN
jgi:hypothetical protein